MPSCITEVFFSKEAALFDADMVQRKLELENKLMNLQAKKQKMDTLLATLKSSRDALTSFRMSIYSKLILYFCHKSMQFG